MLRVIRGIVRPEFTRRASVAKAAGADTSMSRSETQIRNGINNPIYNPINNTIAKLNGTRKLRNAIYNRLLKRRRDAGSRARLRTLSIIVLTRIAILRRVYAMKRTKIFDPTSSSSGWDDSWRTDLFLFWSAWCIPGTKLG